MAPSKLKGKANTAANLPRPTAYHQVVSPPHAQVMATPQSVAQVIHQQSQQQIQPIKIDPILQPAGPSGPPGPPGARDYISPIFGKPPPINFTHLITDFANQHPPTPVTLPFRNLLATYSNAVFTPYEIKVICAMIEPSILLPTSPLYDPSIDGITDNPADVSARLLSPEFAPEGQAFVHAATKVQAEKTSAAWTEHNERLRLMINDVWLLVKEREQGLKNLMDKHGFRHPIVQAMNDAVRHEHMWLNACVLDNQEGYAQHRAHLDKIKAESEGKK